MIEVQTEALVTYACTLNDEDEAKVREYAKSHSCDLEDALKSLFWHNELNVYDISAESDFSTQSIELTNEEEEE